MPLSAARLDATARFVEAQSLHRYIESRDQGKFLSSETQTIKGLFLVSLYAYLEYSIRRIVSSSLSYINLSKVKHSHLIPDLYPILLNDSFNSIASLRGEKQWRKRHELISLQHKSSICTIDDSVLSEGMQNIRSDTINLIATIFAIEGNRFVDLASPSYINEICERRNAVSHGRESPIEVGRRYTSTSLEVRLGCASSQITLMLLQHEDMLVNKKFIRTTYRRYYLS